MFNSVWERIWKEIFTHLGLEESSKKLLKHLIVFDLLFVFKKIEENIFSLCLLNL